MLKLAFLASNNGTSMRAIVEAVAAKRLLAEARIVVRNKRDAAALAFAQEHGIPARLIPTLPDAEQADRALCDALTEAEVDLVILSGYLRKLGPATLQAFAGRILNTHPALLPKFGGKGMYGRRVHEAVLAAGECKSGVTIHQVDGEYDHGAIMSQRVLDIPGGASVETLETLVMDAEQALFVETLSGIQAGKIQLPCIPSRKVQ